MLLSKASSLSKEYLWILNHGNRTYSELKKTLIEYDMMVQSTNPIKDSSPVPTALAATTRSAIICDNCKRVGHIRKNCWARGGGSEGKGPRWYNAPKGMEPSLDTTTAAVTTAAPSASVTAAVTYDFCDTDPEGMDRPLHRTSNPDTSPDRLGPEAFALVSVSEVDVNSAQSTVLSVPTSNTIPSFIDSGASHWCIRNRARFVTYTAARSTGRLASEGTSGSFDVEGFGMAEITVKTEKGEVNCLRFLAKHTPTFRMNLLSLPAMDRKGLRGAWGNGRIEVIHPTTSKIVVDGSLAGHRGGHGLYEVCVVDDLDNSLNQSYRTTPATNTFALAASGRSRSKPCSLEMWHTRFGHADINMIRIMAKRKTVEGLEVSDFTLCGKCEVCLLAKAKRKPFDDIVVPSSEPLDRISLDLWGPARTQSLGGARYMMLACDDGTGIPFPHFLPNKEASTVLGKVETFVAMAERQTGRKVRVIRIDMGREFDNRTMDSWCAERGILIEKIPKASSAANGQVERANGTIIEGVRSMIEDSDLDHRFWAEAANSHCYIRGMIPTSRHPGIVPWEKWFEAKRARVNVSHLRRWGCRAWVTDLDRVNGKLGRQAWEGRLVGYLGRRGYRIWDPARRAVYPVRDVEFEEGIVRRTLTPEAAFPISNDADVEPAISGPPENVLGNPEVAPPTNDITSTPPPPENLPPPIPVPAPLRRSNRVRIASERQIQSQERRHCLHDWETLPSNFGLLLVGCELHKARYILCMFGAIHCAECSNTEPLESPHQDVPLYSYHN
ncbi:hypothetical protein D9757_011833 [Collybiopsis confluens]|uniref:Integrase catalytic domain-containing protein n=1 Tax=Collybiopsis confluens TaxID=2823264 RepID=A0A8H5H055_9AGAR|nr:hypothetical protein D9757_011833 [Collybiopsis confluens]